MFRIAKNLVKTLEQSVQDTLSGNGHPLDAFFQSIPPNLLLPQQYNVYSQGDGQESAAQQQLDRRFNEVVSGLRVVFVEVTQLQLQSYFDYIVGINDEPIPLVSNQHGYFYPDYSKLVQFLNDTSGTSVKFNVWSAKGGTYREEYIAVRAKDETHMEDVSLSSSVSRPAERAFQPLGFKVQWSPLVAATFTYHVLNLNLEQGPAAQAGLIPDEDYIIGCQDGLLATGGETLLQDIVRSRANHDLVLYVYNKVHDCVRPLTVHIGSDGRLGCNVGYGFLHRIPTTHQASQIQTPAQPKTQYDMQPHTPEPEPLSEAAFVPTTFVAPHASAQPQHHRKKQPVAAATLTDYFQEGKDQTSRLKGDAGPPPTKVETTTAEVENPVQH
ncbi:GRH1 (YDR517W) [Zygosaccharomyces parabailii]|nr:GRH1 (YDR517W) [Zygosaccharomyces parabailii]CDH09819.1 related to GRASP65 homolog protein 1 [Zygosaccharomyces bailii ISA1307]